MKRDGRWTHARRMQSMCGLTLVATLTACQPETPVEQPRPLGEVTIDYPLDLWDQNVEGETLLRILVGDAGGVDSIEVLESSGHPSFDSAAVEGARELRFAPARLEDGKRVEVWAEVPIQFSKRPPVDSLNLSSASEER